MKQGNLSDKKNIEVIYYQTDDKTPFGQDVTHEDTYEILYLIHGTLELCFKDKRTFSLSQDSVLFLPANTPYFCKKKKSGILEFLSISFRHHDIAQSRREILFHIFDENLMGWNHYYTDISNSPLFPILNRFIEENCSTPPGKNRKKSPI